MTSTTENPAENKQDTQSSFFLKKDESEISISPASSDPYVVHQHAVNQSKIHQKLARIFEETWHINYVSEDLANAAKGVKKNSFLHHDKIQVELHNGGKLKWVAAKPDAPERISFLGKKFDQESADALVGMAISRGWTQFNITGKTEDRQKIWIAAQKQNLKMQIAFQREVQAGKISPDMIEEMKAGGLLDQNGRLLPRITIAGYDPLMDTKVRGEWEKEKQRIMQEAGMIAPQKPASDSKFSKPASEEASKPQEQAAPKQQDPFEKFLEEAQTKAKTPEEKEGIAKIRAAIASGLQLENVDKEIIQTKYTTTAADENGKSLGGYNYAADTIEKMAKKKGVDLSLPRAPEQSSPAPAAPPAPPKSKPPEL